MSGAEGPDYAKRLHGYEYEVTVKFLPSQFVDPDSVLLLRYALIKHGIAKGRLEDIFHGRMRYTFNQGGERILAGMKLPQDVRKLYAECRPYTTPILSVNRIGE